MWDGWLSVAFGHRRAPRRRSHVPPLAGTFRGFEGSEVNHTHISSFRLLTSPPSAGTALLQHSSSHGWICGSLKKSVCLNSDKQCYRYTFDSHFRACSGRPATSPTRATGGLHSQKAEALHSHSSRMAAPAARPSACRHRRMANQQFQRCNAALDIAS